MNCWSQLAMSAQTDRTLHVAFRRDPNLRRRQRRDSRPVLATNRIITSGPQHNTTVLLGSNGRSRSSKNVTTPTLPCHPACGTIDRRVHDQPALRPIVVLFRDTATCRASVRRTANSTGHTADGLATAGKSPAAAERRPMPPATSTTSRPMHLASGQLLPNGPRKSQRVAGPQACHCPRHIAGDADRVIECSRRT